MMLTFKGGPLDGQTISEGECDAIFHGLLARQVQVEDSTSRTNTSVAFYWRDDPTLKFVKAVSNEEYLIMLGGI